MSEGKYGKLPKPKDRSKSRVNVELGAVELQPDHDKAGEWDEEGDTYHHHAKPVAKNEPGMLERIKAAAGSMAASASKPWASMMADEDDDK